MSQPSEASAATPACGPPCAAASTLTPAACRARLVAGLGFLLFAGALAGRRMPGGVSLWPASLVPVWFGISHLVAGATGYPGCPELGAIPSVLLDRQVATGCGPWQRIDSALAQVALGAPSASA